LFALEEVADTLPRFCIKSQRLGSATLTNRFRTNCLKSAGTCMTEGGASSESDRLRAGSEVSSLKGWVTVRGALVCRPRCRSPRRSPYLGLAGLARRTDNVLGVWRSDVIQIVLGVILDLDAVSLSLLSCHRLGPCLPRCGRWHSCHCCRRATGRQSQGTGSGEGRGGRNAWKTFANPSVRAVGPRSAGDAHLFEKTWLKFAGELGESV
jgi:hypothetical protein